MLQLVAVNTSARSRETQAQFQLPIELPCFDQEQPASAIDAARIMMVHSALGAAVAARGHEGIFTAIQDLCEQEFGMRCDDDSGFQTDRSWHLEGGGLEVMLHYHNVPVDIGEPLQHYFRLRLFEGRKTLQRQDWDIKGDIAGIPDGFRRNAVGEVVPGLTIV